MPSATAEAIMKFGLPTGLANKGASCGDQTDEDTTDNGSCWSDTEANYSSEAASVHNELVGPQPLPTMCSFLAPTVASRRNALQQVGQKVLASISHPPRASVGGGAQKKTLGIQHRQALREQVPRQQAPWISEPWQMDSVALSKPSDATQETSLQDSQLLDENGPKFIGFDAGAPNHAFDPRCPLKKIVPDFFFEEPPRSVLW